MDKNKMNNFLLGFSLLVTGIFFQTCLAGPYPERPVKVIVGLGPGSSLDTVMRLIGQNLAIRFGAARCHRKPLRCGR